MPDPFPHDPAVKALLGFLSLPYARALIPAPSAASLLPCNPPQYMFSPAREAATTPSAKTLLSCCELQFYMQLEAGHEAVVQELKAQLDGMADGDLLRSAAYTDVMADDFRSLVQYPATGKGQTVNDARWAGWQGAKVEKGRGRWRRGWGQGSQMQHAQEII